MSTSLTTLLRPRTMALKPISMTALRLSASVRPELLRIVHAPSCGMARRAGIPSRTTSATRLKARHVGAKKKSDLSGDMPVAMAGATGGALGLLLAAEGDKSSWMRVTLVASTAMAHICNAKPVVEKDVSPQLAMPTAGGSAERRVLCQHVGSYQWRAEEGVPPSEMTMTMPRRRVEKALVRNAKAARRIATGAKLLRMWMNATEQYR